MNTYENETIYFIDKIKSYLLDIIPDANEIEFHEGNWITFKSKGNDKREKKCVCKYDNNGFKYILKQIDVFKKMRYMINGQPISNCKIIYEHGN